MDSESLRALITQKLADGRLPHNSIPRIWGGKGNGEICDACGLVIGETQLIMEGVSTEINKPSVQFHVQCLYLWDAVRIAPGRSLRQSA